MTRLGEKCTWKAGQYTPQTDNTVQKWMHQAVTSTPIDTGTVGGRKFRILCAYGIAAIHPDDVTWVLPLVAAHMKMVPIWARATPTIKSGAINVPAEYHVMFPWLRATWTCPTCLPVQPYGGWPDCTTAPTLNRVSTPNERIVAVDGFDSTFMFPWVSNPLAPNTCGSGGPGGTTAPLCIPVRDGQNDNEQQLYLTTLWSDVGQAIDAYNAGKVVPASAALNTKLKTAAMKPIVVQVTQRAFNPYPLLVVALGTGLLGLALRRRYR